MLRVLIFFSLLVGVGFSADRKSNPLDNQYPEIKTHLWQLSSEAKLELRDGEYWLQVGGRKLPFTIPDDERLESVAINKEGTFFWVSSGKGGRLDSLRRWEVARWSKGAETYVATWKENHERLLISRVFSVSKTGRYALLKIGTIEPFKEDPNSSNYTVLYNLRVYDFQEKTIKETGADHWVEYRSQ